MDMVRKLFQSLGTIGMHYYYDRNKLILPYSQKHEHMPDIIINDEAQMNKLLEEFIDTCKNTKIGFTNPFNIKGDFESFFLSQLLRDMTTSDFENMEKYVQMRIHFIKDNTFKELDSEKNLCSLGNGFELSVKRTHEIHRLETPYAINYYIRRHSKPYRLPKVRYGIFEQEDKKVACIYAVQNGHHFSYKPPIFQDEIRPIMNKINIGVNHFRNCEPKNVFALSLFISQLHAYGIRNIIVPIGIPARYGLRYAAGIPIRDDKQLEEINKRTTIDFSRLFQREEYQIQGVKIESIANETKSYMIINLSEELKTKNQFLSDVCGFEKIQSMNFEKSIF